MSTVKSRLAQLAALSLLIAACGEPADETRIDGRPSVMTCAGGDGACDGSWPVAVVIDDVGASYATTIVATQAVDHITFAGICPDGTGYFDAFPVAGGGYSWSGGRDGATCTIPGAECPHSILTFWGGNIDITADGVAMSMTAACGDKLFHASVETATSAKVP